MSQNLPLIASNANEDADILQARLQDWGYLYFKNYVSPEQCQRLLDEFVDTLSPHIALNSTSGLPVLTGEAFTETDALWDEYYPKMQSLERFHAFYHQPALIELMEKIAGKEVFVYPMKMARVSTPKKIGYETPAHQDAKSHVAGPTMCGIWTALQNISADMGRLKLLPRSHLQGVREVVPAQGVGNVQCKIFDDETTWHVSNVEQGDVIIFHSYMVHKAEPNKSEHTVRMSVDTRFCDYGAPVFYSNKEPHHAWRIDGFGWESIYKNWKNKDLQYYWQDYPAFWGDEK